MGDLKNQSWTTGPYQDDARVGRLGYPNSPPPPTYADHMQDDESFNTSAIHGENDPYSDDTPQVLHRPMWRRKSVLYSVAACLVVLMVVVISVSVSGGSKESAIQIPGSNGKSPQASSGAPNADNTPSDEPVVGKTKDGPRDPEIKVPVDLIQTHRDEFGTTLIGLYDRYNIEWGSLSTLNSPQYKALLFVAGSVAYPSLSPPKRIQRYALATFYYSTFMVPHGFWTDPTDWVSAHNWLTAADECDWEGVSCEDGLGHVTGIDLSAHALSGSLPLELAFLDQLEELDLSSNFIHMSTRDHDGLRVFGMLHKLRILEMGDNYILTIDTALPTGFGSLSNLQRLGLSYNLLQGPLDGAVLSQLTSLTHLEIESNYISGTIPTELGRLTNLYYLYLRRNSIDIDLTQLLTQDGNAAATPYANIFSLWLDDNQVVGTIPTQIGLLSGLASFSLTNTTLGGSIPSELGLCTDLQRLWLYSNRLSGRIPSTLQNLVNLQVFEIQDNQVTGSMPQEICSAVAQSDYEFKVLSADCSRVRCSKCCTLCY